MKKKKPQRIYHTLVVYVTDTGILGNSYMKTDYPLNSSDAIIGLTAHIAKKYGFERVTILNLIPY